MQAIAISDDITTCECCGRSNLKRTLVMRDENRSIRYYGTSCAAMAIFGYSDARTNNQIRKSAIAAQTLEQQWQQLAAAKAADAREVIELLAGGATLNHPVVQRQHRIWRQVHNVLHPGPNFIPWRQWLADRAAA